MASTHRFCPAFGPLFHLSPFHPHHPLVTLVSTSTPPDLHKISSLLPVSLSSILPGFSYTCGTPGARAAEPGNRVVWITLPSGLPGSQGLRGQNYRIPRRLSPRHHITPCIPGDSSRVPPPGSPHSQRTVWKAQRGCFSKLSPNLRTRSRRSRYASPAGPFILVLCLALGPGHWLSQPSRAAAPASAPGRSSGPCGLGSPGACARPLERPESRLAVWRQMPRPSPAVPPRPSPPRPPSAPFPASRRTPLCERRFAEVRGARCGSGLEVDGGEAEMR